MARTSVATDDFSGTLGNWTQLNAWGAGNCAISGGVLIGAGVGGDSLNVGGIVWSGAGSFSNDQYCKATIGDMDFQSTQYIYGAAVRCSGDVSTNGGQMDFYVAVVPNNVSPGASRTCRLAKVVNGTHTSLQTGSVAFANGDTLEIEVEGTTLRFFKNGVQQFTATDSALTTGKPALFLAGDAVGTLDDFEGGDVTAAVSFIPRRSLLGIG